MKVEMPWLKLGSRAILCLLGLLASSRGGCHSEAWALGVSEARLEHDRPERWLRKLMPRGMETKLVQTRSVHCLDQWLSHGVGANPLRYLETSGSIL